jgi:class 3 adenylate cyclase
MGLKEELREAVAKIIRERWTERTGEVVPEPEDLKLGNDAVNLDATILYADMAYSTRLVDKETRTRAAEVYKTYMVCAAQIIKNMEATITAYDGDRVMGVFVGGSKNTNAAKTALKINWALREIVNPANKKVYGDSGYELGHVIGIDTSSILACRIGVRNDNDIVWVGRAANYAAKLSGLSSDYPIFITGAVFDKLDRSAKYGGNPERLMWEEREWTDINKMRIYRSNWTWAL